MSEKPPDTVQLIGARVTFVPMHEATTYSLVEWDLDPEAPGPPVHIHHQTDEGFYVMSGHVGFWLDGITIYGKPGAHVTVPKGHAHSFWNAGARPARCLCIISPPGFEQYFRALAAGLGDMETQDAAIELRRRLSATYDMEVVDPPPPPGSAKG